MNTDRRATIIIIAIVVIVALGVAYFAYRSPEEAPLPLDTSGGKVSAPTVIGTSSPTSSAGDTGANTSTEGSVQAPSVKEFTVTGQNFSFSPASMTVKKGDTVKITFKNSGGMHDWKIDEFSAGTKVLQVGQQETIQFVADKAGTFEYYCSVGQHRAMGMKGSLIVQ